MSRDSEQGWLERIFILVIAGMLTAVAVRYGHRLLDHVETNYGYTPNPAGVAAFLAELDQPYFSEAGADALKHAKDEKRDTFLYRAGYKAHEALYNSPWVCPKQGIGDCVSFGWAYSAWISLAVDYETGRLSDPPLLIATESLYGGSRVEARGRPEASQRRARRQPRGKSPEASQRQTLGTSRLPTLLAPSLHASLPACLSGCLSVSACLSACLHA